MTTTLSREIEPFVDANKASEFLVITRRRVLEMARGGEIPAYPVGRGKRKQWRFRLSELADAFGTEKRGSGVSKRGIIDASSPRQPNRRT
jgi:hypothetical protein